MSRQINGMIEEESLSKPPRKNQFGDYDDGKMTIEKWTQRWQKGQTKFHQPETHPMLLKHYEAMTAGQKGLLIFLPLCGKSVDMNWLSEQGHSVVGCEAVELGCQQFYEENNIAYTTSPIGSIPGKVFKSEDPKRNVVIYCCDFFKLSGNIIRNIDCIWDRGSMAAIDVDDRERYAKVVVSLMDNHTTYMLDHFLVDNSIFAGPPYNLDNGHLKALYGADCDKTLIDEVDAMTDWQRAWGVTSFTELVHLMRKI